MSTGRKLGMEILSTQDAVDALDSGQQISCPSCLSRGLVGSIKFPSAKDDQNLVTVVVHHNEPVLKHCEVKMSKNPLPTTEGEIQFLDCGECGRNEWHFEVQRHLREVPPVQGYKHPETTGEVSIHLKCIGCGNALSVKCRMKEKPTEA